MNVVQNRTTRIVNSGLGIVFLVLCLFYLQMPYFFAVIPVLTVSIPYVRWGMILVLGVCTLCLHGSIRTCLKKELLLWGTLAWTVLLYISTRVHGGELGIVKKDLIPSCLLAVLIFSVFSKADIRKILLTLFLYFLIINTLNNASIMFFANSGVWIPVGGQDPEFFFFGHINESSTCAVSSLLFGCIYARQYQKSWDWVNWANIIYSIVVAAASKCVVALVLYILVVFGLLLCYACERWNGIGKVLKWLDLRTILIVDILVELLVIPLGRIGWMEAVGLDVSVHGRRDLWDVVLAAIRENPVIGKGYFSWFATETGGEISYFWHQHSIYLMVAHDTGLIGILIFVFMFVIALRSLRRVELLSVRFITGVLVGGFLLTMTVECCARSEIFLLLGVCYSIAQRLPRSVKAS